MEVVRMNYLCNSRSFRVFIFCVSAFTSVVCIRDVLTYLLSYISGVTSNLMCLLVKHDQNSIRSAKLSALLHV